jgi:hypothetical protein
MLSLSNTSRANSNTGLHTAVSKQPKKQCFHGYSLACKITQIMKQWCFVGIASPFARANHRIFHRVSRVAPMLLLMHSEKFHF